MEQLIPYDRALEIMLNHTLKMETEVISLEESLGRVLAQDILAMDNLPPFDRSPLDGYAVNSIDIAGATRDKPIILRIIEEVPAGYVAAKSVGTGHAIKVTTGAPIPKGADTIIPYEATEFSPETVKIFAPVVGGSNISKAGEDVAQGELVLYKNTTITSEKIGMLAALGMHKISVYRKPSIGILSTGDELIPIEEQLTPGKIRNSNMYILSSRLQELGCQPVRLGIIKDECQATKRTLQEAIDSWDMVITTGGVSVGDYDLVKDAMEAIGGKILFWKVDIRPGTPVVCCQLANKLIIGLSGNPAAALITFELLVVPLLKKSLGLVYKPVSVIASLTTEYTKATKQMRFLRGRTTFNPTKGLTVELADMQSPGIMRSLLNYNSLIVVPAGSGPLKAGDRVEVILIKELEVS